MKKYCDLHTHSLFSDGTWTPAEIIGGAEALGLSAVALCDHNTISGLPDFLAAAAGKAIEAIPGVEFSTAYEGKEIHVLGLYMPESCYDQVSALVKEVNDRKELSNIDLVDALNRAGYRINYEAIKKTNPNGRINRAHIADALTRQGYTASIQEAFATLLAPGGGYYHGIEHLPIWQVLDFIRAIGATPVLAHPFLQLTEAELLALLPRAKQAGLLGMECRYSLYGKARTEKSLQIAASFGLLPSGGSDFHGGKKPDIHLGSGKGDLQVPAHWAQALKP